MLLLLLLFWSQPILENELFIAFIFTFQMFGKIWICDTLDVGLEYSTNYGLTCVTLEGDQVNKKGVLMGGFVDTKMSKLKAMKAIKQLRKRIEEASAESRKVKKALEGIDQEISRANSKIFFFFA